RFRELEALQGREHVLVGHGRVVETWPPVTHVTAVLELRVVLERRPLRPTAIVRWGEVDGPPPGPVERVAERESVGSYELVVAPLIVRPDARLQGGEREPADAAETRRAGERATSGEAGVAQLPGPLVEKS